MPSPISNRPRYPIVTRPDGSSYVDFPPEVKARMVAATERLKARVRALGGRIA
jgi:hypothetical protein